MSTADEFKAKGNAALAAKNFTEAVDAYTEAIKIDPSNHVYYSNRSAAHLSNGNAGAALADGESCIGAKADWPKGYSRKGAALHTLKRYDDAEATYQAGLEACPGDATLTAALKEVQDVKARAAAPPPNPFGNIMAKLAAHPNFATWVADPVMMSKIQMLQQNPQGFLQTAIADPACHPLIEAAFGLKLGNPGDFGAGGAGGAGGDGVVEEDSDDEEGSVKPASAPKPAAAPKPAPAAPPPPKELSAEEKAAAAVAETRAKGNKHYAAKEWAEALACYDEVLAADASQVSVLNNKAAVFMEMGDLDAAEKQCGEAIEAAQALRPTPFDLLAKIYVRWGKVYVKRKDLGKALEYYDKAQMEFSTKEVERLIKTTQLDKRKLDAKLYVNPELAAEAKERGNDAFRAQDWATAIKEYEEAIKRDPKNPAYQNNLSATLCKVMDFQGAKRAVEKAIELDPKYVKAWARKGDIEFLQKEYHKAMESYQKGLSIEPKNRLCEEGLSKTIGQINRGSAAMSEDEKKERAAHGMADPEIQQILGDPIVRQVIQDLSTPDPKAQAAGQAAMSDPAMSAKINKLIAAGVLQTA